jgi:hypothetical protein
MPRLEPSSLPLSARTHSCSCVSYYRTLCAQPYKEYPCHIKHTRIQLCSPALHTFMSLVSRCTS